MTMNINGFMRRSWVSIAISQPVNIQALFYRKHHRLRDFAYTTDVYAYNDTDHSSVITKNVSTVIKKLYYAQINHLARLSNWYHRKHKTDWLISLSHGRSLISPDVSTYIMLYICWLDVKWIWYVVTQLKSLIVCRLKWIAVKHVVLLKFNPFLCIPIVKPVI